MRWGTPALALIALALGSTAPAAQTSPPPAAQEGFASPAQAPAVGTEEFIEIEPVQVPLSADLVERYLKSYPEIVKLGRDLDRKRPKTETSDVEEAPEYALLKHLGDPAATAKINRLLARFGFQTYADWANVAFSVGTAAEAADPSAGAASLEQELRSARAELDADQTLSPEEKKNGLAALEAEFAALAAFEPPPENIAVVKPFLEKIRALGAGG